MQSNEIKQYLIETALSYTRNHCGDLSWTHTAVKRRYTVLLKTNKSHWPPLLYNRSGKGKRKNQRTQIRNFQDLRSDSSHFRDLAAAFLTYQVGKKYSLEKFI